MKRSRLVLLVLASASCQATSQATLQVAMAGGAGACSDFTDLKCVNFVRFTLVNGDGTSTQCIRLAQHLSSLCDVKNLGQNQELFRIGAGDEVTLSLEGVHAFPESTCDQTSACEWRRIFTGTTGKVRGSDIASQPTFTLLMSMTAPCGPSETFSDKRSPSDTCDETCGRIPAASVASCDGVLGGCLCRSLPPDAGAPDGGLTDGGPPDV